ncbi:hypothetical protein ACJMK2_038370 [Sinanodonta woodiana]|uniref:Ion transport domain-containing protein n=2 Tax=Sinanodonta woodiana TaxID=1069815 RepID=A0ABD3W8S2_SINWO
MDLIESLVVLLLHQILEITKTVLEDRVLLLHGLGGEICSIVTTSDFNVNKSVLEDRVLLLHGLGRELCIIVTASDFRDHKITINGVFIDKNYSCYFQFFQKLPNVSYLKNVQHFLTMFSNSMMFVFLFCMVMNINQLIKISSPNWQIFTNIHVVLYDEMFDLLLSLGADLNIKNRQGLTPLTLAAKLARKDMYEHILEKIRQVYWIYGNVTSAGYPLQDIDTITATGEIHENSALNLIVYGDHDSHLSMMDGLVVNLLQEKWKTFARYRFYRRFIIFIIYFVIFVTAFVLRPGQDECPVTKEVNTSNGLSENVTEVDRCYLMKVCQQEDIARFVLEGFILFGASTYLFLAMKEIYHQGFKIFFTTLKGAPGKATFLLSCVFVVMMLPGRAACAYVYEDVVGVLAILTTAPYFLFFCRGFRIIGPFVVMIYKMIKGDLLRFCIIYLVFIIGFSQAFYIAFIGCTCEHGRPCVFTNGAEGILGVFAMSVGQFEDIYATFGSSRYPELIKIVFVVYMIMVTLLLVNMLIAMMGNTYQLVNETQKEWFRQWAKIVLVVEQSVTTLERQKYQIAYSQPINDKRRAFVIRWHQSESEKEELRKAREEQRRKQKEKVMKNRWQKVGKTALFTNTLNLEAAKTGRLNI